MLGTHLIRRWWNKNPNSPALVPVPRSCYCTWKAWGKISTHTVLGWWRERRAWAGPPKTTERPWAYSGETGSELSVFWQGQSSSHHFLPRGFWAWFLQREGCLLGRTLSSKSPHDVPGTHYTWGALPPERAVRPPRRLSCGHCSFVGCPESRAGGDLWEAPRH